MNFLSTLVGIQHVQRYIPLADPDRHGQGTLTEADGLKAVAKAPQKPAATVAAAPPTVATPARVTPAPTQAPAVSASKPPARPDTRPDNDATREMPRPAVTSTAPPTKKPTASPPAAPPKPPVPTIEAVSDMHNLVINDAVRLLNWGRPWHELAELVARIADRPKLPEVRRLLRSHRAAIEMRVADSQAEKEEKEKEKKKD
jgi:hypothetical protein